MTLYTLDKKEYRKMPCLYAPAEEFGELLNGIAKKISEKTKLEEDVKEKIIPLTDGMETCEAITKRTAFEEIYPGGIERVLCEENPCLKGHENRYTEKKCVNKIKRYICPLHNGVIHKLFIR